MCGCSVIVGDDSGCGEWIKKANAGFDSSQRTQKNRGCYPLVTRCKKSDTILIQKKNGIRFIKENLFYSLIAMKYIKEYQNICNSMSDQNISTNSQPTNEDDSKPVWLILTLAVCHTGL